LFGFCFSVAFFERWEGGAEEHCRSQTQKVTMGGKMVGVISHCHFIFAGQFENADISFFHTLATQIKSFVQFAELGIQTKQKIDRNDAKPGENAFINIISIHSHPSQSITTHPYPHTLSESLLINNHIYNYPSHPLPLS